MTDHVPLMLHITTQSEAGSRNLLQSPLRFKNCFPVLWQWKQKWVDGLGIQSNGNVRVKYSGPAAA